MVAVSAVGLLAGGLALLTYSSTSRLASADSLSAGWGNVVLGSVLALGLFGIRMSRHAERSRQTRVCYALTDRRAIIWVPEAKSDATRVYNIAPGKLAGLVRIERPDGTGDLVFSMGEQSPDFHWYPFGFRGVAEVRRVDQIIRNHLLRDDGGA